MPHRPLLALLILLALAAPATASAATSAPGWRCQASALDGSLLAASLPAVAAGGLDRDCKTAVASLPGALPAPLQAASVVAATSYADGRAVSAGGVTDLRVRSLPELPVALPAITIPDSLGAVVVPLPTLPLLPLLPSSITVDVRPAVEALLPVRSLPALDLVAVQGAVAYAAGACRDGRPQLSGLAQVTGLQIAGLDTPVGEAVDRAVTLLGAGSVDTASIDTSKVLIPSVAGITDAVLRPIVEAALAPLLPGLPDVALPEALARVQVTPGERTESGGVLTQRALHVNVSVLGTTIADLAVGTAAVAGAGVDCAEVAAASASTPAEAALACTHRKLALIDVLARRRSVRLLGAADRSLAGRSVRLVFDATGRTVARATVRADGSFSARAPLPRRSLRSSNLARYRAVLGSEQSLNLKLQRRMLLTRAAEAGGRITISGRVLGLLARGRSKRILVKRRTSCTTMERVATVTPRRSGRFTVSFRAPAGQLAPVYRLQTRVRKSRRSPKTYPTYTLPRPIAVG